MIHASLGEYDAAFALLDRESRWNTVALLGLRGSAFWQPLRADLRWPALLRRLGIEP